MSKRLSPSEHRNVIMTHTPFWITILFGFCSVLPCPATEEVVPPSENALETLKIGKFLSRRYARLNDANWINYGPGIIECCHSMELWDVDHTRLTANEKSKSFPALKDWLKEYIYRSKLNCSPNVTHNYGSVAAPRHLTLYSSTEAPRAVTEKDTQLGGTEYIAKEKAHANWLLLIPITPEVLGCDQVQADKEFAYLKKLMSSPKEVPFKQSSQ